MLMFNVEIDPSEPDHWRNGKHSKTNQNTDTGSTLFTLLDLLKPEFELAGDGTVNLATNSRFPRPFWSIFWPPKLENYAVGLVAR
jgi:hypothetical protein